MAHAALKRFKDSFVLSGLGEILEVLPVSDDDDDDYDV